MKKKLLALLRRIFGWGMLIVLMVGGLCFPGYLLAVVTGEELICTLIYKHLIPVLIYATNVLILFGVAVMYLSGEKALTADTKGEYETET